MFQKIYVWKECQAMFFVNFNIIISYIFRGDLIESLSEDMNFHYFNFNYFRQFFGFFNLYLLQKTNDVSIYKIISPVFWLGIILDMLLKNCIKLY